MKYDILFRYQVQQENMFPCVKGIATNYKDEIMKRWLFDTFLLIVITATSSWAADIGIYPETIEVKCGQPFTIEIVVNNATDLMGARFMVNFDPSSLRMGNYESGKLLASGNNAYALLLVTPAQTGIEFCTARLVSSGNAGVTGNGTIATICFTPIKSGSVTINISDVDLRNPLNQSSTSIKETNAKILITDSIISIFPNPYEANKHSNGYITFSGLDTGTTLQIYTISGEFVERLTATNKTAQWYVKDIASGVYFCVISDKDRKIVKKIGVIK